MGILWMILGPATAAIGTASTAADTATHRGRAVARELGLTGLIGASIRST
jgi:hypothetical protein